MKRKTICFLIVLMLVGLSCLSAQIATLEGYWTKDGGEGDEEFYYYKDDEGDYQIEFHGAFPFPIGYMECSAKVVSFSGSTMILEDYFEEERYTVSARLSGNKLTLSGLNKLGYYDVSGFNGIYTKW
jgi:hypothetical protein